MKEEVKSEYTPGEQKRHKSKKSTNGDYCHWNSSQSILEKALVKNMIVLGDFNLDTIMQNRLDYPHKTIYGCLDELTLKANFKPYESI